MTERVKNYDIYVGIAEAGGRKLEVRKVVTQYQESKINGPTVIRFELKDMVDDIVEAFENGRPSR